MTVKHHHLAAEVCARHLAYLGLRPERAPRPDRMLPQLLLAPAGEDSEVVISWRERSPRAPGVNVEVVAQALSGLMSVHGRDERRPRRIGLEVASVASGILAAQGALAALIARTRGMGFMAVDTSALQAGLLLLTHYIAAATAEDPDWEPPGLAAGPGPPFCAAGGEWIEIETFDPDQWRSFWAELGVGSADAAEGWGLFVQRYETATCSLPPSLHEAFARRQVSDLVELAARWQVSLCPLRGYGEVLADGEALAAGSPPWRMRVPAAGRGAGLSEGRRSAPTQGGQAAAPLAGIRVVEATRRLQGPLAGRLLSMLGAEVIRVEARGGDLSRGMPPLDGDIGAIFLALNRGKRAVELDVKRPGDCEELRGLLSEADVFLHNWRPGRAEELGLGAEACAKVNPRLVHASAGAWGEARRPAGLVGTDYLVQAFSAMGDGLNPSDEPGLPSRVALVDLMGALVACEGVLAALLVRQRQGRAPAVATSLLAGAMALQEHVICRLVGGGDPQRRSGRPLWGVLDRPLATASGFLAVAADGPTGAAAVCEACGVDGEHAEGRIARAMLARPAPEWVSLLRERSVPCAVVAEDLSRLPEDPVVGGLLEPSGPRSRAPAPPWRFSTEATWER